MFALSGNFVFNIELLIPSIMILRIDRNTRLKDIQTAFTGVFAFLKLEFFRNPHQLHQASPKKDMRSYEEPALSADKRHTVAEIEFDGRWKVSEVEDLFFREAGLFAQVFRRSGNVWIETSLTDDWTLEQQNREGESLSAAIPARSIDVTSL